MHTLVLALLSYLAGLLYLVAGIAGIYGDLSVWLTTIYFFCSGCWLAAGVVWSAVFIRS